MKKRFLASIVALTMLFAMAVPFGAGADVSAVTKNYFDVNFDNWQSAGDDFNSSGGSASFGWIGSTATFELNENTQTGGKHLSITPATSDTSPYNYYVRSRVLSGTLPSNYSSCDVLWTEFSVKYEGGFVGFGFGETDNAYNIISINKNGKVEKFTRWGYGEVGGSSHSRGTEITGGSLELGKWYHFAAALDFTDSSAASSGAPLYVWMNGELIENGARSSNTKPSSVWKYHKLWIDAAEAEGRTISIDNLKIYETEAVDTHIEDAYNVTLEDEIPDDYISIEDETIKTPSKATIGDVIEAFPQSSITFMKDDEVVTDEAMSVAGVVACVYSSNGLAYKEYALEPDTVTYPVTVVEGYGEPNGAGEYSVGDKVTIDAGRKQGYKFTGWTVEGIEVDDLTAKTISFVMDGNAKSFTANWEFIPVYKVEVEGSFAQNTGNGQYYDGEEVTIDAGEREGYIFTGWTAEGIELTEEELSHQTITFTMNTVPKKFIASWYVIPKYKVEISGSYADVTGEGEYYPGATITISAGQKPKADFNCWKPYGVELENRYDETTTFVMPEGDVKVIASWYTYASTSGGGGGSGGGKPVTYEVSFVTNGGTEIAPVSVNKGETLPVADPVKEGYIFGGWYLDEQLTKRAATPFVVSTKTTLYAKWIDEKELEEDDDEEEEEEEEWLNPFNDVKESSWYFEAVKYMYDKQYCEGFGWGQFGPDVELSRAMLVTILHRIEGEAAPTSVGGFADVASGVWYENAVNWASENGIVTGYNSYTFAPDDLITREQIAAILYRYAQIKGKSTSEREDISGFGDIWAVSSYANDALSWAVAKGYISGRSETELAPQNSATRAEALTVLYRFIKK